MSEPSSAAQRYKQIVEGLDEAADTARAHDRERAAELGELVGRNDAELRRSGDRAALSRAGVELRWESAVQALWAERWFLLRVRPEPDRHAHPDHLDALDRSVEETHEALLAAIRRRRLPFRRT